MELIVRPDLKLKGRLSLVLFDAEIAPRYEVARLARSRGQILQRTSSDNLLVTGGLNMLTLAINWALVQNDNVTLGSPYAVGQGNLGEFYGALGTGATAVSASQSQLAAEVTRATIASASVTTNIIVYDFFIGQSGGNGTIAELGCFMQGTAVANSGTMLDRSLLSPTIAKTSANTAILEFQLTISSG